METIFFVSGARDYQAMDWYQMIKKTGDTRRMVFVTNLIRSKGCKKLVNDDYDVGDLFNIDRLLLASCDHQTKS